MTSPDREHSASTGESRPAAQADPRVARQLMIATYVAGMVGLFIGFFTVNSDPPSLTWAVLLVVTISGGLSFVRHSIFRRSDAARIGWITERRNNFQIEAGIANFAWATVALLAVIFDWGLRVEAATLLTFGIYLAGSATMLLVSSSEDRSRSLAPVIGMATFGVMQIILGLLGMNAA